MTRCDLTSSTVEAAAPTRDRSVDRSLSDLIVGLGRFAFGTFVPHIRHYTQNTHARAHVRSVTGTHTRMETLPSHPRSHLAPAPWAKNHLRDRHPWPAVFF